MQKMSVVKRALPGSAFSGEPRNELALGDDQREVLNKMFSVQVGPPVRGLDIRSSESGLRNPQARK
jgi:hypothetical protein